MTLLSTQPARALISVHDVMATTVEPVKRILELLAPVTPAAVTLLVVPGGAWRSADIDWLQQLQHQGYQLAGHGWQHHCEPRGFYHRLHSLLISRHVAEHLAMDAKGIVTLVRDCHDWMRLMGLSPSSLYVPPAWALGRISRVQLSQLPFGLYETLGGVYDARSGRFHGLPLLGYEADTVWRALAVRCFNHWNLMRMGASPIRLSIHPYDLDLLLARDLREHLAAMDCFVSYQDLMPADIALAN